MNIRVLHGDPVFTIQDRPASYSQHTDPAGIVHTAVQESPAQVSEYTIEGSAPSKTPWGLIAAGVAAWLAFK